MSIAVYRAPLRSRCDDVDPARTFRRAMRLGLCGFGERVESAMHDDRLERRIARFAAAPTGSFVWTRTDDGFRVGRMDGPLRYDDSTAAREADLVHVRPCTWRDAPMAERHAPAAVVATFARGGRNFQRIHDAHVLEQTERIWLQLEPSV